MRRGPLDSGWHTGGMPGEWRPEREELAGRDGDLEQVRDLVNDAVAGRAGGLLVTGEAGVGKTSLARRACADAAGEVACLSGVPQLM